jgi:hypothetical protein
MFSLTVIACRINFCARNDCPCTTNSSGYSVQPNYHWKRRDRDNTRRMLHYQSAAVKNDRPMLYGAVYESARWRDKRLVNISKNALQHFGYLLRGYSEYPRKYPMEKTGTTREILPCTWLRDEDAGHPTINSQIAISFNLARRRRDGGAPPLPTTVLDSINVRVTALSRRAHCRVGLVHLFST